jgi:hypothetical protein
LNQKKKEFVYSAIYLHGFCQYFIPGERKKAFGKIKTQKIKKIFFFACQTNRISKTTNMDYKSIVFFIFIFFILIKFKKEVVFDSHLS